MMGTGTSVGGVGGGESRECLLNRERERAAQSAGFRSSLYAFKDEEDKFLARQEKCRLDLYDEQDAIAVGISRAAAAATALEHQAMKKKKKKEGRRGLFRGRFRK